MVTPLPSSCFLTRSAQDGLRNELIQETVSRAFDGCPFYRELYLKCGLAKERIRTVDDLHQLPIVTKDQLREAGRAALCHFDSTSVSHIQNTTGTTGEQFFVYRSTAETQFIYDFYAQLAKAESPSGRLAPIMLQIQFPHHGSSTPVPAPIFTIPFSVNDDQLVDYAVLVLRKKFDLQGVEDRVSILSGSQTGILALTSYLLEQGIDCRRDFAVKLIHLQGRYLTSRWRRVLQETWGAETSDKYSLAELFGGASWCPRCKGFHFDPHVVPELVTFPGGDRLEEGTGVLVLTSLYPFVQLQPMIRYFTGDLFRLDSRACSQPRFEFLGRLSHALFSPENPNELWLSGVDVVEALDPLPEINRTTRFKDVTRMSFGQATGRLRVRGCYRLNNRRCHLTLRVEASVPLSLYPDHRRNLEQRLTANLLARSARLAEAVNEGNATTEIEFLRPGTLGSLERFTKLWIKE